ncbi:hypothetical protein ACEWY4_027654 [Coilia grayii]|uniref:Relaxin-3 n=1 Tax=Coilia grayii TaxID=363190 RepID=A0ABD1IRW1_9TELE
MMWKSLVLAACLLLIGCEALDGPAYGYGVKLCGREFIRAVIFTCGGSRWRRSEPVEAALGLVGDEQSSEHWLADTGALSSSPLVQETEGAEPQEVLRQDWPRQQGGVFARPARSLLTNEILEALRTADRKGRDVVVGLSNACCKWGCSKTEISSLC